MKKVSFKSISQFELTFFKYSREGWTAATQEECNDSESFNPHTQKGKKDDSFFPLLYIREESI